MVWGRVGWGRGWEGMGPLWQCPTLPPMSDGVSTLVSTDAAAGTGSDQAEGSQPDGPGRHRPSQETENGLAGAGCQRRGKERVEVAGTEMLSL